MDSDENSYCRLCADLKLCSDLSNLEINLVKRREIVKKLKRFNIKVDFNNILPKTVCFECINSLERAFDFVTTVDQAQEAFNSEYGLVPEIQKKEIDSDDENRDYEHLCISNDDDVSFKREDTILEPSTKTREDIEVECKKVEPKKSSYLKPISLNRKKFHPIKKPKSTDDIELSESWDDYIWSCGYCGKQFQNADELKIHSMQFHSTCNAYNCFDCGAIGLCLDNFVMHIRRHRPFLILTCHKCSLKCSSMADMRKHKATHLNTDYVCSGCNSAFPSQDKLDEHTTTFYKDKEARALPMAVENDSSTCVFCRKTLKNVALLNRHLLLHTERTRDHVCDVCGKGFYDKKTLTLHLLVHSDKRPFNCELCTYSFKIEAELRKHVNIHFGVKPFSCEKCGKNFRRGKELRDHSLIHTDLRPHVCSYCDKTFRFRHLLVQHIRLHTGVKPYSCDVCMKSFRNWSNYNKHMKEQHGIDKAIKKHTVGGTYPLDPATGQVIHPETDELIEWRNKVFGQRKLGRPKKTESSETVPKRKRKLVSKEGSDI